MLKTASPQGVRPASKMVWAEKYQASWQVVRGSRMWWMEWLRGKEKVNTVNQLYLYCTWSFLGVRRITIDMNPCTNSDNFWVIPVLPAPTPRLKCNWSEDGRKNCLSLGKLHKREDSSQVLTSTQRGVIVSPLLCVYLCVCMVIFHGVNVQMSTWRSWLSLSSWGLWWRLPLRCPLMARHVYAALCWAGWCTGPSPPVTAAWGNPGRWWRQQWGALCWNEFHRCRGPPL